MPATKEQIKDRLSNGNRACIIERHGDEWRLAHTKGGVCIGTSSYDSLPEAKRWAKIWSDDVRVKR